MQLCRIGMLVLLVWAVWMGAGYAGGIDPLIRDLKARDETTRIRAVVALGHSGDPTAVRVLREALNDESQLVRRYALHALMDLLRALEHTSRLVSRWLHDLLVRLEQELGEPPVTTAKEPIAATRQ